jgi:DNA-binding NarL/FixJ family response regulator
MTIRLVVADDHTMVLQGLEALLELEPDLEVVATCTDGHEVVEAAALHQPDIVVLDAVMPGSGGLEAHLRMQQEGMDPSTVVLSATVDDETLRRCLESSVAAIVLKDSAAADLVGAIRTVHRGGRWIPQTLKDRALDLMARRGKDSRKKLTPREREVVLLVAKGESNKGVATKLGISRSTVKQHLHNVFRKLDVANRTQLSLLAREWDWL